VRPLRWIGLGLIAALATGGAAWAFSRPFLTSYFRYLDLPVIGKMPVASALLFDIGVCAVVVGSTVLVLIALAHQSIRTPRAETAVEAADGEAG
jgi:multicomponent K+:H+ antiporter subunit A